MPEKPFLMPKVAFCRDIGRTPGWYSKHLDDPAMKPPLPRPVRQGPGKTNLADYIVTEHGEHYKRELLRLNGLPVPGRPPKVPDAA